MSAFLSERYNDILVMSKRICKGNPEYEDVCHYCIAEFMEKENANDLIVNDEAMKFLSGMIHRSFHSSTSPYHKIYRQSGKVHELYDTTADKRSDYDWDKNASKKHVFADIKTAWNSIEEQEYDYETDLTIEAIQGVLEDMESDTVDQWFRAILFKMWIDEPNFSELERKTKIPRTSISKAVQECKQYIRKRLEDNGINY